MKNKKNMRRFLSGFLAMLTVLSTILSPILSYAADVVPEEPPLYEEVKNELDADEVVKAKDLELETGSIFEVEKDFTGLEIPDEKKVKITFHEAKNEEKQDFTTDYEDTYKAVYYVEPVSGHPIYQINRKLIVKEAVVQSHSCSYRLVQRSGSTKRKPHAPPLVRVPVNSFEFHSCERTPQVDYLLRLLRHRCALHTDT